MNEYPEKIVDKAILEDLLSVPTEAAVKMFSEIDGDIMFLGIGGKIGPTLAMMAIRACKQAGVKKHIYGVSLFESGILLSGIFYFQIQTFALFPGMIVHTPQPVWVYQIRVIHLIL